MRTRKTRKQSGQALIEFAFIVILLLTLLLGIIEVGRYAYLAILVGNAARAGVAYGAQNAGTAIDSTGIQYAADYDFAGSNSGSTSGNGQTAAALTVSSSLTCGCDSAGTFTAASGCNYGTNVTAGSCTTGGWVVVLSVTASGTFSSLFHYPFIPASITISRTAQMRVA